MIDWPRHPIIANCAVNVSEPDAKRGRAANSPSLRVGLGLTVPQTKCLFGCAVGNNDNSGEFSIMASLSTDKNGNHRITFREPNNRQLKTLYIGKMPKKNAKEIERRVELLVAAKGSNSAIDLETAEWLKDLGADIHAKLVAAELAFERSATANPTLGSLIDAFIAKRADAKERTRTNLKQATDKVLSFFGADTQIRDITPVQTDDWVATLRKEYAPAYVSRLIKYGKQVFHAARRAGLIDRSPFDEIKAGTMANPERMHFVALEDTEKIIAACPTSEWRLIMALARYGGLRCPSELLALRWGDIDWDRGRFLVRSPKTAHHADGGRRWVPIFPELHPHLEAAFNEAPEGQVYVISRTRSHETNLRTAFERIVYKAGLLPWSKPFQNMRSSRETELMKDFPLHVVCNWIGNTALVAVKHYLQVTDADFEKANRRREGAPTTPVIQTTTQGRRADNAHSDAP